VDVLLSSIARNVDPLSFSSLLSQRSLHGGEFNFPRMPILTSPFYTAMRGNGREDEKKKSTLSSNPPLVIGPSCTTPKNDFTCYCMCIGFGI
jgi:hypothetical protein